MFTTEKVPRAWHHYATAPLRLSLDEHRVPHPMHVIDPGEPLANPNLSIRQSAPSDAQMSCCPSAPVSAASMGPVIFITGEAIGV